MDEKVEFTKLVFRRLITGQDQRLKNAYKRRNDLKEELDSGNKPKQNYRYQLIDDGSWRVMDVLKEVAEKFNENHKDDLCTVHDFIDILETTIYRLKKSLK